jgi:hypothetical protein
MLLFIVVSSEPCFIHFGIDDNEIEYGLESEDNEDNYKYELKLIDGDENVEEPKKGMTFNSIKELSFYYRCYAKKEGFGVV